MTVFTLQPYVGALPITFEMDPADVAKVLGSPDRVLTNYLGEVEEHRGPVRISYHGTDGTVAEIEFYPGATLSLHDADLLEIENPIEYMLQFDSQVYEFVDILIFLELGVSCPAPQYESDSGRSFNVFRSGSWDELAEKFPRMSRSRWTPYPPGASEPTQ
jgi:hypothetical protein